MTHLSNDRFNFVSLMTDKEQNRLDSCIHECGHAIAAIDHGFAFKKITLDALEDLCPDGMTLRKHTAICLGGWAAMEAFCNMRIDIQEHFCFSKDVQDIKNSLLPGESFDGLLRIVQPEVRKLFRLKKHELTEMAFAMYDRGELGYLDCLQLYITGRMPPWDRKLETVIHSDN